MTRRVLPSPRLPELRSSDAVVAWVASALIPYVAQVYDQFRVVNLTAAFLDADSLAFTSIDAAAAGGMRIGAGADDSAGTPTVYLTQDGATELAIRNSTDNVEGFLQAGTSSFFVGARTNHSLALRANNLTALLLDSNNDARFFSAGGVENAKVDTNAVAGNTRLMIYDVDNGTLERVSVGAADSGGAGFKVLRIPN